CALPLTGVACVKKVVTELAVLEIKNNAFHLLERAPGISVEEIISKTEGTLIVPELVPEMSL
ncbi:MAG: succinyl-CoA--3-ketoacid-CoA transferase, partial [Flavobacteriia bacterium]|nr:succinyl-CoA--3-ketoacid-CoA transferase [Flavobacteriia bacterium]